MDTALNSPRSPRASLSGALQRIRPGTAIFIFAILVRMCVLFRATDTTHFLPTDGDMKFYSDWALRIAGGKWTDHQAFYGLPLYAYLLAALYSVLGFQPYIALLLQVCAEATTAWLIYRTSVLAFSPAAEPGMPQEESRDSKIAGTLAALGWIFFVPAQAYSTILMPTTYFVAAFWLVVWWTLRTRPGLPALRTFFLLGLGMGFESMMVANILFLSGFVVVALFLKRSWVAALPAGLARWRVRAAAAVLLFAGIGLGMSPCWIHNYFIAKEPVLLSAHSGINFYIGNNPASTGYPKVPDGMRADQAGLLLDSITYAQKQTGRPLKRYEVSAFWSQKAHQYIVDHPREWLHLMGIKLGNFWNAFVYDDLGVIRPMQEDNVLLPGIGFGIATLFGLPGLVLAVIRRPRARWIAAAVLLHMGSLLTVFVTERYRMAAVPGLLMLGGFGLVEGWRLLLARRWVPGVAYALVMAGAFVVIHRPVPDEGLLYLDDYNTGIVDLQNNNLARARAKLERVYTHNPNNAESCFAMGNLALAERNNAKAMWFYRRTIQLDPRHHRAMNNLGVLAMEEKQWKAAETLLNEASALNPGDAKIFFLLAKVHAALHELPEARASIETALLLEPDRKDYQQLRAELISQASTAAL